MAATRTSAGFRWVMRPSSDDHLGPGHEMALDAVVRIPEGGVLIDVGAHVGHFAIRASRRASAVVAFEPGDFQRAGLQANLEMNGITNVRIVPKAAWSKPTRLGFRVGPDGNFGRSVVYESPDAALEATTVDAEAADLARVDFVKIDVQGAEAHVLEGARETIAKHKPRMMVELHDREMNDPRIREGVEARLRELGYAWRIVHSNVTNDYLYCVPLGREEDFAPLVRKVRALKAWEFVRLAPERVRDGVRRRLRAAR